MNSWILRKKFYGKLGSFWSKKKLKVGCHSFLRTVKGVAKRAAVDFICMTPKGRTKSDVWRSWEDEPPLDLRKSNKLVVTSGERGWGRGTWGRGWKGINHAVEDKPQGSMVSIQPREESQYLLNKYTWSIAFKYCNHYIYTHNLCNIIHWLYSGKKWKSIPFDY